MTENRSLKKLKFKLLLSVFFVIILFSVSISSFCYGYKLIKEPILAVLLFHDVVEKPKDPWEITPQKLEYYIEKLLALKYKPVDPNNFENLLSQGFEGKNFMITFDDGTKGEYAAIENIYKKYGIKVALFLVGRPVIVEEHMTEDEIRKLKTQCETFLCLHAKYHSKYTEQLQQKIDLGKITEETRLYFGKIYNTNIKWLSYPFGDYNKEVINELKNKTAITHAFTIIPGNVNKETDKFEINRYMYMGGLNQNYEDLDLNLSLIPPESDSNGKFLITLSVMALLFGLSRLFLAWKYYKALAMLKIEDIKMNKQNDL